MSHELIRFRAENMNMEDEALFDKWVNEASWRLRGYARLFRPVYPLDPELPPHGGAAPSEVIIAVAGIVAGPFFALLTELVRAYFNRRISREVAIERNGVKVVLKGRNVDEEMALLKRAFPDLFAPQGNEVEESSPDDAAEE